MIIQVEENELKDAMILFDTLGYQWVNGRKPPLFTPARIFVMFSNGKIGYHYFNPNPKSTLTFSEFSTKYLISIL